MSASSTLLTYISMNGVQKFGQLITELDPTNSLFTSKKLRNGFTFLF